MGVMDFAASSSSSARASISSTFKYPPESGMRCRLARVYMAGQKQFTEGPNRHRLASFLKPNHRGNQCFGRDLFP
jgi:hypothetical protein